MDELTELCNCCYEIMEDVIKERRLSFCMPSFEDDVKNDVIHLLIETNIPEDLVVHAIGEIMQQIYENVAPIRSRQRNSVHHNPHDIQYISKQLEYLKNCPQPLQRTPEWYESRNNCLTASNIWKVFGSESSRNQLIYEKCTPAKDFTDSNLNVESTLHKGQCYEPLSIQWYEHNCDAIVADYGAIRHPSIPFICASPDGINVNECSESYGRMLEVKNIFNREINGIPKMEYWIQMQLQMEVCQLDMCDFLETRFIEYDNWSDFESDGTFNTTSDNKEKGIFLMFMDTDGKIIYKYPPFGECREDFDKWEKTTLECYCDMEWIRNIYWRLDQVSCVVVERNKLWFAGALPLLTDIWSIIQKEKVEGFEHRKPKRKRKISREESSGCIIHLDDNST